MNKEIKTMVRIPQDVRDWFRDYARENDRSMNGQLNAILRGIMSQQPAHSKRGQTFGAGA